MIRKYLDLKNNLFNFSKPDISNRRTLLFIFVLLLLSALINLSSRLYEKNVWQENSEKFYVNNEPLLRAGDPAYFLNISSYLKKNIPIVEYNNKLNYPNAETQAYGVLFTPLLSSLISYLAEDSSRQEIVKAGNRIILMFSVLTTIGIFFLFFAIGRPYEGIIASTGAGITIQYFNRSSIGYVDTDILNLFFMYFLFGLVYLASLKQSWNKTIIFIVIAGLVGKTFYIWYPKSELILMSFLSLFFFTIINTRNWKKIFVNCFIYILLTNPSIYLNSLDSFINNPYLSSYLSTNVLSSNLVNTTPLNFNDIFRYIGEQQKPPLIDLFKLNGSILVGLLCFIGIALWFISYPMLLIGFSPLIFFFLLSMILGQRAVFYSLPFMWFGFSYLINFIVFKIVDFKQLEINKNYTYLFSTTLIIIFTILFNNAFNRTINFPYIQSDYVKAMIKMDEIVTDKNNSVIAAPWTYGYQSLFYNDIPILIHPGIPASPRHYFIARAYASFDLEETKKILNYLASGNVEKINEKKIDNFVELSKDIYQTPKTDTDIYFMLTQQQRLWMKGDSAIAFWDIENNKPHYFGGKTSYDIFNILEINCDDLDTKTYTTNCADKEGSLKKDIPVDLAKGLFNNQPVLNRVVQISDGIVEINEEYGNEDANLVFQIVKNTEDDTSMLYLMHDAVFRSVYNKLFHLNQSDGYDLVYDDYPHIKIYKVN